MACFLKRRILKARILYELSGLGIVLHNIFEDKLAREGFGDISSIQMRCPAIVDREFV